ncbi:MAG: hypothetical protein JXR79_06725 [Nitrospirae bacterium]|nr:hypothetical protein [Nitrospirota bacterium]
MPTGQRALVDKYQIVKNELETNSSSIPFHIESYVSKNASHVDIYSVIKYSFDSVQNEFLVPTNWCEILLPHTNVRACTYNKLDDTWLLNVYNVDKHSDSLEKAYQMKFEYRVSKLQSRYFDILLAAREGPSSTKNHEFELEAIPVDKGNTLIHLRYSYRYSPWTYLLMKLLGGSKTGFSVTGMDSAGNPVYVDGLRGSVERNVVCFYIAILAYLETSKDFDERAFEKRIAQWYDLAGRLNKQLIEMKKEEYLMYKLQDHDNQKRLQKNLKRDK